MIDDGVSLFVEVGPGRVLSGLLVRIDKGAGRVSVQGPSDFDAAREAIAEARAS
jgi:malonyl CoA-acyl carrier protein transacylase